MDNMNELSHDLDALMKRVYLFLEDKEWESADNYCEKILDIDPENDQAYLGKLLAELKISDKESLGAQNQPFDNNKNYQKLLRFADEGLVEELSKYNAAASARAEETANQAKQQSQKRNKLIVITLFSICAAIGIFLLFTNVIIPNVKYNNAVKLMEAGNYIEAYNAFTAMNGYKDSDDMKTECTYGNAVALMNAGNIVDAYDTFIALNGYKDSAEKAESIYDQYLTATLKAANVGDIITFGSYENEKIDWYVLEKTEDRVFVISQYFVDVQCYDEEPIRGRQAYWDGCSLRTWLNDTFLNEAFTETEKSRIPTVEVKTHEGYVWTDKLYLTTEDRVYLLSSEEAKEYPYEVIADKHPTNRHWSDSWWLRGSAGVDNDKNPYAWYVKDGTCSVTNDDGKVNSPRCVRPVLWIEIE